MDQYKVESSDYIEFKSKGSGSLNSICVIASLDCDYDEIDKRVWFTFEGDSEWDDGISGMGWVKREEVLLVGYLKFHHGDEVKFKAKKKEISAEAGRK